MHIKELQLTGFKSFHGKTTLQFSPGMNAVIGPNGCGKTNILDALRWVLGEQSFSLLRCARNEDLVFGGTVEVPATNYADVRLVLAGSEVPRYGSEIEIRRRFFRSGESEYYLNRQPCRLKDIQEVFLASGIGTKAYSIFDLKQMREIVAGNTRRMFEEAATLAKYRDAKADCQRKLELTDKDLIRLEDIVAERERVVRSLRRQAGKLRSYDKLKEEEGSLRLLELKDEFGSISREFERVDKDTVDLEKAEAERLTEIRRLDEELRRHRGELRKEQTLKDELAGEARKRRQELAELEGKELLARQKVEFLIQGADRDEQACEKLKQGAVELERVFESGLARLAEANSRQTELEKELNRAREATKAAEQKLYDLRSQELTQRESLESLLERQQSARQQSVRLEAEEQNQAEERVRLKDELKETDDRLGKVRDEGDEVGRAVAEAQAALTGERGRIAGAEAELAKSRDELSRAGRELGQAKERRTRLEKELAMLRSGLPDRLEKCRAVLGSRILGELGRLLSIDDGWELACEAALQPVAEFLVTDGEPQPGDIARLVEEGPASGCGLIAAGGSEPGDAGDSLSGDGVVGRLADHVEFADGTPDWVRRLVESFTVARDAAAIVRLAEKHPDRSFVAREGCARFADGRLVIAARDRSRLSAQGLIQTKAKELGEREASVADLTGKQAELQARTEKLQSEIEGLKENLIDWERKKSSLSATRQALASRQSELVRDQERQRADLRRPAVPVGRADPEKADGSPALARARKELAGLDEQVGRQTGLLKRLQQQVVEGERAVREELEASAVRLAALSEEKQKTSRLEAESDYAKQAIGERRRRASELQAGADRAREQTVELGQHIEQRNPETERVRKEIEELEVRVDRLRVADLSRVEEELEENLSRLRQAREQNQNILMEQRMRKHELNQQQATIVQEAREEYATDIAQFEPEEATDAAERLTRVRRRLEALGAVNPLARDEYEQEKRDLEQLSSQRQDVATARENLLQAIAEIDQHARDRFLSTYEEVRLAFKDVFSQLFLEGEADLVLADEQKPLESDITIVARPRGKTLKRLEQLSDGEKALLAVSLLFAFYRVKPAPFCFLDEIDAPLDDANVGRFADYLKSISKHTQVVIITHNRLTVERASILFGVTSEQPGISKLVSVSLAEYQTGRFADQAPADDGSPAVSTARR